MNTTDLIGAIIRKLLKYKILILAMGIILALVSLWYVKGKRPVYTAKATIFPLSNVSENSLSSNALSGILGLSDAPKSFSSDAAINIIELTYSRYVREAVASCRLAAFGNKTITELLIEDYNRHKSFLDKAIIIPKDSAMLAVTGGEILKSGIVAKMSKNGVLELYYSHPDNQLISPVCFVLIDKVSQFYIDLKIKKATADYNFTVKKIDSLDKIINSIDRRAINIQNTTLFAPDKLEYAIPKERVSSDKQRYMRQRDISLNNQEEALWRLQKLTPIISVLDKPTAPFTVTRSSFLTYTTAGFIVGCLLAAFICVFGLLYQYARYEIQKSIFGEAIPPTPAS